MDINFTYFTIFNFIVIIKNGEYMEKKKINSLALALLVSLAVCLVGSVIWGLLYQLGFLSTIIAAVSAFCALNLYKKFYKLNWIAYVWTCVWFVIFNEIAMLIAESIAAMTLLNCDFGDAFREVCNLISTDVDARTIFISNTVWNIVFSVLGAVAEIIVIRNQVKQQKYVAPNLENNPELNFDEKFKLTLSSFQILIDTYKTDKDKEKFQSSLQKLTDSFLANNSLIEKEQFKLKIKEELLKPDISEDNKNTLRVMEKVLK